MEPETLTKAIHTAISQVPNLIVLGWIIAIFLTTIKGMNERHLEYYNKQMKSVDDFREILHEMKALLQSHIKDSK